MNSGRLLAIKAMSSGFGSHSNAKRDGLSDLPSAIAQQPRVASCGPPCQPTPRKRAICYTDFLSSYAAVLPSKRHRAVGKETGETAHVERGGTSLRQRCANLVRKTLSFSKDAWWHELRIRLFIEHYNRCHQYRPVSV